MKNLVNVEIKKLESLPVRQKFCWKINSNVKLINTWEGRKDPDWRINTNHIHGIINKNIGKDWNEIYPLILKLIPKHARCFNDDLRWTNLKRYTYDSIKKDYVECDFWGRLGYSLNDVLKRLNTGQLPNYFYKRNYMYIDPYTNTIKKVPYPIKKRQKYIDLWKEVLKNKKQVKNNLKRHYESLSKNRKIDRNIKKLKKENPVHILYDPRDLENYDYIIKFTPELRWYSTYEQQLKAKEDVTLYYEDKMIQKEDLRLNQNNDVEIYTKFSISNSYIKGRENIIKFCKEHNKSIIFIPKPLEYFKGRYW